MSVIHLQRKDLKKISQVLEKFPESTNFWLRESASNGIGTVCTLDVETEINGTKGIFQVEIFGVNEW